MGDGSSTVLFFSLITAFCSGQTCAALTLADGGFCRASSVPAVVGARQHAGGRVGQQVLAHRPAGAEAAAAVPGGVIGLVVGIAPAQSTGIKTVLLPVRRAGNDCPVEPGVVFDRDVISVFVRKQQPIAEFFQVIAGPQKRQG